MAVVTRASERVSKVIIHIFFILLSIAAVVMTLRGSGEGLKNKQKINAECCKLLRFSGKCVIILPTVRDGGFRFRSSARPEQG